MKQLVFLILSMFLLFSCQNKTNTAGEEDLHDHSEVNIKRTAYNSDFEVFAEITPFVNGEASGILAHFTKLPDFKPLENAKVTASLIIGTKGIRQTLEVPTRKGIYLFQLQPEVTGKGKLVFDIQTSESNYSITIPDIEVFADDHDAIHEAEEALNDNPNAISFTKEQSWKVDFATGLPESEAFGSIIKTTAHVQSTFTDEIILTAKTNGIATFQKNLSEGSEVIAGYTLLSVSGEAFADNNPQVRLVEAKNNFEKAEINYQRNIELAKDKIVSEKALLESKNEFENAKIVYENLKYNFAEKGQKISSTKSGFIRQIYVNNLEYVEAGTPILSIIQNKNLFLKADVQQKYINDLPFISTANIRIPQNNKVFTLDELNGKIVAFGKNVSEDNFMIPITLQIENRKGIIPGSFVEIFLKTKTNKQAITVPNSALLEEQGNFFVLVQLTPESFEKRQVSTGKSDGINTEIISGIGANDRLVTRGAVLVKLASVSNSIDPHAGHVH